MEKLMLASQSIIMTAVTLHRITRSLSVKQVAEIQRKIKQPVVLSSSVIHLSCLFRDGKSQCSVRLCSPERLHPISRK